MSRETLAAGADVRPGVPGWLSLGSLRAVDWGRVRWELEEFSDIALRHVPVDRGYQYALDEARARATQFGIVDDRVEVVEHWRDAQSWFAPPVMVAGDVLESSVGYELLVGYTRLGNLLGMLDREEAMETQIWFGSGGHQGSSEERRPIDTSVNFMPTNAAPLGI
jgi:hypothetical protein